MGGDRQNDCIDLVSIGHWEKDFLRWEPGKSVILRGRTKKLLCQNPAAFGQHSIFDLREAILVSESISIHPSIWKQSLWMHLSSYIRPHWSYWSPAPLTTEEISTFFGHFSFKKLEGKLQLSMEKKSPSYPKVLISISLLSFLVKRQELHLGSFSVWELLCNWSTK